MCKVFASRLMPFISFEIVSYAADLTLLSFWRLALAKLVGIFAASSPLAHFGSELVADETDRTPLALVVLLTAVPFVIGLIVRDTH